MNRIARLTVTPVMSFRPVGTIKLRFLFSYYLHVAVCISVTAMCVSHWYFYRDDAERNAGTGELQTDGQLGVKGPCPVP